MFWVFGVPPGNKFQATKLAGRETRPTLLRLGWGWGGVFFCHEYPKGSMLHEFLRMFWVFGVPPGNEFPVTRLAGRETRPTLLRLGLFFATNTQRAQCVTNFYEWFGFLGYRQGMNSQVTRLSGRTWRVGKPA
jgi:hypothetical protein